MGLTRVSVKDRLEDQPKYKPKGQYREKTPNDDPGKNKERERRICNNCKVRGHLARNCTQTSPPLSPFRKRTGETKRAAADNDGADNPPSTKARTVATDKSGGDGYQKSPFKYNGRGGGRHSGVIGRGGRNGTRPPYIKHTTEGVTCTHCGIKNHTAAQCWSLHEELRPPRPKRVNMANVRDNNLAANRRWEAD